MQFWQYERLFPYGKLHWYKLFYTKHNCIHARGSYTALTTLVELTTIIVKVDTIFHFRQALTVKYKLFLWTHLK